MINEDDEHGDISFHLAWEAMIKKELFRCETISERLVCRKELIEIRETIRKLKEIEWKI